MTIETITTRPAGHTHKPTGGVDETSCPYCGQPISRKEFREIQARIEGEERARIAKVEQALKDRFGREKAQAEAKMKAEIEKAKKDATKAADTVIAARLKAQRGGVREEACRGGRR
jgi:uncharacterized Zn finger protein (UPF0148 family)